MPVMPEGSSRAARAQADGDAGDHTLQAVEDKLLHLFNHQTHHRGQAHACLSILTGGEPPSLDLLAFQRGTAAPTWRS